MDREERKKELSNIREFMQSLEKDPAVRDLMEKNQRRYGTLTESELKKAFTV